MSRPPRILLVVLRPLADLFSKRPTLLAITVIVLLNSLCFAAKVREKDLPEHYRQWLTRDVVYIISNEEKQVFLNLASDEARDKFIEQFWEVRNPTPGAPTNPYKEETYRRIAYANQFFAAGNAPGWDTARGRIYITLGEPKQRAPYLGYGQIRPMEIWFYDSGDPALGVPFFYVLFYKPDPSADFRIYSPFVDGPEKLIANDLTTNNRKAAFDFIDKTLGREVARTSLSLIPSEPVDMDGATPSMQSDMLMNKIRGWANLPMTKDAVKHRRELLEGVTHRLILPGEYLNTLAVPLRDHEGNINLHYVLRVKHPEDFAVAQSDQGRYYYSLEVSARVLGADGKLIYSQDRKVSHYLDADTMSLVKGKLFGYEGWLPLAPGKYKVEFLLTNLLKRTAYREEKEIVVPDVPTDGIRITDPVPFSNVLAVDPMRGTLLPFSVGGLKFTPEVGSTLNFVPGQKVKFFYQMWAAPNSAREKKFAVDYSYGRVAVPGDVKTIHEDFTGEQFDSAGSLVNGKTVPLNDAGYGDYRLTMTLVDGGARSKNFSSINFHVVSANELPGPWDITDEDISEDVQKGTTDYERGLCYLAAGDNARAIEFLRRGLQKSPGDELIRARLISVYFTRNSFADIAELYARSGITEKTDDQTLLQVAESLDHLGNTKKAIDVLESALTLRSGSGPIYLTLASYYRRLGNEQKASDLERKGRSMMVSTTPGS